jgi:hypothetical protein
MSQSVLVSTSQTSPVWAKDEWGNIRFNLVSNGFTGKQWAQHFSRDRLSDWSYDTLCRVDDMSFRGKRHDIIVTGGCGIKLVTLKIRQFAALMEWREPHWEVACLIADAFTDDQIEEMGLWRIITMHQPIQDSDGYMRLFSYRRHDAGYKLRTVYEGGRYERFEDGDRFAFVK